MRDGGKGDTQRPLGVPLEKFDSNWDAIFKKKPVKTYAGGKPNRVLDSTDYDFDEKTGVFTPKEKK
jgi:hypothetical protein